MSPDHFGSVHAGSIHYANSNIRLEMKFKAVLAQNSVNAPHLHVVSIHLDPNFSGLLIHCHLLKVTAHLVFQFAGDICVIVQLFLESSHLQPIWVFPEIHCQVVRHPLGWLHQTIGSQLWPLTVLWNLHAQQGMIIQLCNIPVTIALAKHSPVVLLMVMTDLFWQNWYPKISI